MPKCANPESPALRCSPCVNRGCRHYRQGKAGCVYGYDIAGTCETKNDKSDWIPIAERRRLRQARMENVKGDSLPPQEETDGQ